MPLSKASPFQRPSPLAAVERLVLLASLLTTTAASTCQPPIVSSASEKRAVLSSSKVTLASGDEILLDHLHTELQLTYVHNLVTPEQIYDLVRLADERNGWRKSPLKIQKTGADIQDDLRNSSSCPMLWPLLYKHKRSQIEESHPELLPELDLVNRITNRIVELFTATELDLTPEFIEPLQLVRYDSTERFGPHHDYHELDHDGRIGGSSVQGEQRIFTVLIFGSTLGPEEQGETHFPELDLKVSPRIGDALVWSNVDGEGAPNPRSLHEGRPPSEGAPRKFAINCWVADKPFSVAEPMQGVVKTGE